MWVVCYRELRSLTNSKAIELNPLELSWVHDKLWLAGTLLQTPNALSMLDDAYRPWEKLHPDCDKSKEMHRTLDANLPDRKAALRIPADRKDAGPYKVVLLSVLKLFGEGMHESLQRTMGNYLEATNGKHAESRLEQWEIDRASGTFVPQQRRRTPVWRHEVAEKNVFFHDHFFFEPHCACYRQRHMHRRGICSHCRRVLENCASEIMLHSPENDGRHHKNGA
jgi:hypothetical protein